MAQPLNQFWPIFCSKSDGQEVVNQKGKILRNGPSQEQLDRTPNEHGICDFYRLIEKDDPKHMDWRKKLGGMLLREIGGKPYEDKWSQCILHEFPEGYKLYEHIKSKASVENKLIKNHSGGGHDRQDAYLYGYPKGPKKRFRSPIEFFPHLLWLSTDETSDYQNCTCRICSPLQLSAEKPALPVNAATKPDSTMFVKKEGTPLAAGRPVAPFRRPSAGTPTMQSPSTNPATPNVPPNAAQIRAPERLVPTPLPQPRSIDQQMDGLYNKFIARTGEVVWFFRLTKQAWGLGLVVRRWLPKDGSSERAYLVQPLSHPFDSPTQELITTDQIKPWLAWSAPSCTYSYLQQNPTLGYDQVPWNDLMSGRWGNGITDVDASILSAKAVDTTYTLFERLKSPNVSGVETRYWNGIYLGGEKIWNGEPVRLRLALGTDVMVVTAIVERITPGPPNQPNTAFSRISFTGDVYSYKTLPAPNPNAPPQAPTNNSIPMRMREDIRWRNQLLVPATRTLAYWDLVSVGSSVEIAEIKGRWYETSLIFVEYFEKAVRSNEGGNGIWMNARGDATGVGKVVGTPRPTRVSAFGAAVPKNLQLIEGLDPPDEQNKIATPGIQGLEVNGVGLGAGTGETSFAFDDFMNLDGTDDGGLAFGQDYTFG
jgi:hypothetical protein